MRSPGDSGTGTDTHISMTWWALPQPWCSSVSRVSMSFATSTSDGSTSGAEPQHRAPCPHAAPVQGAPNGPKSAQLNAGIGEGDLPTLRMQDRGSEAEDKGDEQQGGHGCGPLLQKTPRTWPAPQSPSQVP